MKKKTNKGGRGKVNIPRTKAVILLKPILGTIETAEAIGITKGRVSQIYKKNKDNPRFIVIHREAFTQV